MKRFAAALFAIVVALGTPVATRAYTVLESADQTGNGYVDTWLLDDNGDGRADRMLIDGNENGVAEIILVVAGNGFVSGIWMDASLDGYWDTVIEPHYANVGTGAMVGKMLYRDSDQNGRWENAYYDAQLDNYYEWVMVDSNFDGAADTWVANSAPAGHTATDQLARQVANTAAINILHTAGLSVFFPVTTVPLGG